MNLTSDLIDKHEAARILGVSRNTLDNYRKRGRLSYVKLGGYTVRFKRADIQSLIDSSHFGRN